MTYDNINKTIGNDITVLYNFRFTSIHGFF